MHRKENKRYIRMASYIVLCVVLLFLNTISVHAYNENAYGNATGEDGPAATMQIQNGPSAAKTGWIVYCMDWYGEQKTRTAVFCDGAPPTQCNKFHSKTIAGGFIEYDNFVGKTPWGCTPYNANQTSNGVKVRNWMLSKSGGANNDVYNMYEVVETCFGYDTAYKVSKGDWILNLEPIYWCQMYKGMTPLPVYLCSTAQGWLYWNQVYSVEEKGSKAIGKYTNNIFQNCAKLESTFYLENGRTFIPRSGYIGNSEGVFSNHG